MSKKSRRRNKILLAGAALFGASKLGMLGGKSQITGAAGKNKRLFTDIKPKKFKTAVGPTEKKSFPRLRVDSTGNVFKDGKNFGVGNDKTKFINRDAKLGTGTGIYQGGKKVSDLNPKSINVLTDGKISTGGKTYENKKAYSSAMKAKRASKSSTLKKSKDSKNPGLFGFTFDKKLFNKGTMVKARGGGMARNKPTKLY
jgi:hypothetical protein|tara:strand:+ start:343 stop:939 length:597 start_codon:yes stop_codon:yes gene_type:complete